MLLLTLFYHLFWAGTNLFVKVLVAEPRSFIHVRIYQPLAPPAGGPPVRRSFAPVAEAVRLDCGDDEPGYFGAGEFADGRLVGGGGVAVDAEPEPETDADADVAASAGNRESRVRRFLRPEERTRLLRNYTHAIWPLLVMDGYILSGLRVVPFQVLSRA